MRRDGGRLTRVGLMLLLRLDLHFGLLLRQSSRVSCQCLRKESAVVPTKGQVTYSEFDGSAPEPRHTMAKWTFRQSGIKVVEDGWLIRSALGGNKEKIGRRRTYHAPRDLVSFIEVLLELWA